MQNVAASFTIGQNEPITTEYNIQPNEAIRTIFEVNTAYKVIGEGVIDAVQNGNVITITSKTFIFEQGIASDTWIINHNLGKYPSVTLVDTAGTQFQGRVEYIDENNCIVYMNGATKGKAFIN